MHGASGKLPIKDPPQAASEKISLGMMIREMRCSTAHSRSATASSRAFNPNSRHKNNHQQTRGKQSTSEPLASTRHNRSSRDIRHFELSPGAKDARVIIHHCE
jgi:hypothetical protein